MNKPTILKNTLLAATLFSLTAVAVSYYSSASTSESGSATSLPVTPRSIVSNEQQEVISEALQHPKIEVVFALDTTGSMSGMIQAAKEKIWAIATTLASADPAPEISIGLVAYRDKSDDYVTKVIDLSSDLDSVFAQLMQFQAQGGGDEPEAVNQALYEAVNQISWSNDQQAYQVLFLVGDAPAHENEANVAPFGASIKQAIDRGIVVNAIQCGDNPSARQHWQQIASMGHGDYLKVNQNGGAIASATPYDDKLAELSRDLDSTRIFYGSKEKRQQLEQKTKTSEDLYKHASKAALAKRAEYNSTGSGAKNLLGENELLDDIAKGHVELSSVRAELLPEPMVAMSAAEQKAYVKKQSSKRQKLKEEIKTLSQKRRAYMEEQVAEVEVAADSLDFQLFDTLRKQAAEKGIAYDSEDLSL